MATAKKAPARPAKTTKKATAAKPREKTSGDVQLTAPQATMLMRLAAGGVITSGHVWNPKKQAMYSLGFEWKEGEQGRIRQDTLSELYALELLSVKFAGPKSKSAVQTTITASPAGRKLGRKLAA